MPPSAPTPRTPPFLGNARRSAAQVFIHARRGGRSRSVRDLPAQSAAARAGRELTDGSARSGSVLRINHLCGGKAASATSGHQQALLCGFSTVQTPLAPGGHLRYGGHTTHGIHACF
ncbi:hypothetical protein GN956_G13315 [Arapaima gigas]